LIVVTTFSTDGFVSTEIGVVRIGPVVVPPVVGVVVVPVPVAGAVVVVVSVAGFQMITCWSLASRVTVPSR